MILPQLCINDIKYRVELYYPEEPDEPIAIMDIPKESSYYMLMNLLIMTQENYKNGYDIGYNDALKDNME